MFNEAIHEKLVHRDKYPFGRRKYIIPTGRNNKRALTIEHIKQIYYYEPACEQEAKAKDFWLLFYLANGVNPKDVALFKYKNIQDGYIKFERAKTDRTSRNDPKKISVYITEDIRAIIERRGNKDKDPNNYIFPILDHDITPLRQFELIPYFIKFVNKWIGKICEKLNFDKEATSMVARHSFATILKNSGATTEFIKESLGHANIKTTENYLDSFDDETKKENAARLTAFKSENIMKTA
jgi:integrase